MLIILGWYWVLKINFLQEWKFLAILRYAFYMEIVYKLYEKNTFGYFLILHMLPKLISANFQLLFAICVFHLIK